MPGFEILQKADVDCWRWVTESLRPITLARAGSKVGLCLRVVVWGKESQLSKCVTCSKFQLNWAVGRTGGAKYGRDSVFTHNKREFLVAFNWLVDFIK